MLQFNFVKRNLNFHFEQLFCAVHFNKQELRLEGTNLFPTKKSNY